MKRLISINYSDLVTGRGDLIGAIRNAFGPGSLGAIAIRGIPGFAEQRRALLPLSHRLRMLPEDQLKRLERPETLYNVGWSHGKEKIGEVPDFSKGSYYGNPLYDKAALSEEQLQKYPFFYPPNVWPTDGLPELEGTFKQMGRTMFDAAILLVRQMDAMTAAHVPGYERDALYRELSVTRKVKGRLLYYYPSDAKADDAWIGWHNDSGFMTCLTPEMFFDDATGEEIENPDPEGGLWIISRDSTPVHVAMPADEMIVQCGECVQIVSGGLCVATPHAVRPSKAPNGRRVGRATFPLFIDTDADFRLNPPRGVTRDQVLAGSARSRVPPLETRWRQGQTFVEFLGDTFKQYYAWNANK